MGTALHTPRPECQLDLNSTGGPGTPLQRETKKKTTDASQTQRGDGCLRDVLQAHRGASWKNEGKKQHSSVA